MIKASLIGDWNRRLRADEVLFRDASWPAGGHPDNFELP